MTSPPLISYYNSFYGRASTQGKRTADSKKGGVWSAALLLCTESFRHIIQCAAKPVETCQCCQQRVALDDAAKNFAKRFKNSSVLQYTTKAGFNDLGEGVVESIVTDLANQLLKSAYNGKDSIQNGIETEWDRVARNILINTIIAILSGDSGMEDRP